MTLARWVAWSLAIPVALLPRFLHELLGKLLGEPAFRLLRHRREVVLANLGLAFPDRDPADRARLARAHFHHLGRFALDMLAQPLCRFRWFRDRRFRAVGWENLDAALDDAGGKGVVFMCAHLGSWEICAVVGDHPGVRLLSVYKGGPRLGDRVVKALREGLPQELIEKHESARALVAGARSGALLGLIADQGGHAKQPFFGRPAFFPDGPGHFVARYGLPVVVGLGIRAPDGVYDVHCLRLEELGDTAGLPRARVEELVIRRYIELLETWIRRAPEQYYWVHDIWRTFKAD